MDPQYFLLDEGSTAMTNRLLSWELSYFSGNARAYQRYKDRMGDLDDGFEDALATPEL